jgi:transcription antitermination factor NusA-like protein
VVEIRGNAAQVRQVYDQISNQVKALQPKVELPVRGIPPEFYPFIAGQHAGRLRQMEQDRDVRINVPQYHMWQQQPPPRPAEGNQAPAFVPHGDTHISVSGEQAAALEARIFLEQLAEELQKELLLEELAAEQILHPYIVGERGMDPLKFLEETGCAVILPPPHHETEDVHIIGPKDKLSAGRNLAEELMSRKHNRAVDLHKHFNDAPQGPERHSRALAQYLQQKAIEREFLKSHGAEIIFPTSSSASPSWNVISNDPQKALSARNELSKITQAYPSARIQLVEVDPFFHPHLEQMHASNLQNSLGVHMIVPDDGSDPVVLVYEGPSPEQEFTIPRTRPTKADITNFEKALQEAQAQLLSNIPHQGISVQDIHVPKKFHDKVRRFVNNEPRPTPPNAFPVQVDFGAARGQAKQPNGASRGSPERVYLRGPSEADIGELRQRIETFLREAEEDEKERGYTLSFPFPAQYNKNLIGKQGANIKALREKHDVEIDTRENGKITIQGPQKKAEACKAEILRLVKQWEDEVNFAIKIDPKYHGMLVGRNGENLLKIQSKVDNAVRIDFPKMSRASDDASVADNASEVGGNRGQASDEIKIRGPRAKAEKVRDELLSLHQYLVDTSHTATVSVAQGQIASLIGKRGQEMEKLRAETGAQIDIPKADGSDRVTIQIKGTKQQVEKAKHELEQRSKAFDNIVTRHLTVDRKHHRPLIGAGGEPRHPSLLFRVSANLYQVPTSRTLWPKPAVLPAAPSTSASLVRETSRISSL